MAFGLAIGMKFQFPITVDAGCSRSVPDPFVHFIVDIILLTAGTMRLPNQYLRSLQHYRKQYLPTISSRNVRFLTVAPPVTQDHSENASNGHSFGWALGLMGAMALSTVGTAKKSDCCGIVGVVGANRLDARGILLDGLSTLKNRGFDSAGVATMSAGGGPMVITKFASRPGSEDSIELVRAESPSSGDSTHSMGIGHTRWATHGSKTDANAHPHVDASGKIAIVHNGTLNNSRELRAELQKAGYTFDGETDSEVLAKLIGHYYKDLISHNSASLAGHKLAHKMSLSSTSLVKRATQLALARCEGTWGLCVMCSDTPGELVVASHGSPLVLGVADDRTFVASEPSAFQRYTKTFIPMREGEIAVLYSDGRALDLARKESLSEVEEDEKGPDPYPHWVLKECMQQPEAIAQALGFGGRLASDGVFLGGLDKNYERLSRVKHILLSGCGSSLNAARYGERLMRHLGSVDSVASVDSAEFDETDYPSRHNTAEAALIAVSQSGETRDVVNLVNEAMTAGMNVLSVVNEVGSTVARTTKLGTYCYAGKENAVSSTKTFTAEVTVLALVALWFQQCRENSHLTLEANTLKESLMRLPLSFGMALRSHDRCREIAEKLKNKEHCFVLGKGFAEPVAMEGSMKLKELAYFHAEGYSGGALKHGPFALIEGESGKFGPTPVIMIVLDDQHAHHMRTAAEEVKARGAEIIIITDNPMLADGLDDNPIVIPSNGALTALCAIVPLQLISYELALLRGINPDTPRNLAKTLLV